MKFNHTSFTAHCETHGRGLTVYDWSGAELLETVHHQSCIKCGAPTTVRAHKVNSDGLTPKIFWQVKWDNLLESILAIPALIYVLILIAISGWVKEDK